MPLRSVFTGQNHRNLCIRSTESSRRPGCMMRRQCKASQQPGAITMAPCAQSALTLPSMSFIYLLQALRQS
eukprot:14732-Eustigmatos_ZCMA.PRE.1